MTLPHDKTFPPRSTQLSNAPLVASDVPIKLGEPVVSVCSRYGPALTASVAMPEATVYEYGFASRPEHKVGLPRYVFDVKAIAVSHTMNETPDDHLGDCVL